MSDVSSLDRPKVEKSSVKYSRGNAMGDHCSLCVHFQPPHACERVRGHITAGAWCRLFKRKPVRRA